MVEGDLLIDHKQDDNVEEKSNANGTAPDQSEAAGTSQVIDLLVNAYMSCFVWHKTDKFLFPSTHMILSFH